MITSCSNDCAHIRLPARAACVVLPGKMKVKYLIFDIGVKYIFTNYKKKKIVPHTQDFIERKWNRNVQD